LISIGIKRGLNYLENRTVLNLGRTCTTL